MNTEGVNLSAAAGWITVGSTQLTSVKNASTPAVRQQSNGITIPLNNRFTILAKDKRTRKLEQAKMNLDTIKEELVQVEEEIKNIENVEIKTELPATPRAIKPTRRHFKQAEQKKEKTENLAKRVKDMIDGAVVKEQDVRFAVDKRKYYTPVSDFGLNVNVENDEVVIRREKQAFVKHEKLDNDYIPKKQEIVEAATKKAQLKQNSRDQYAARNKGILSLKNMRQFKDFNVMVRLNLHNKRHKCACHKLRFNRVIMIKENEIDFVCDRNERKEIIDGQSTGIKCANCKQGELSKVTKELCDCCITVCDWCFYQTYVFEEESNIVCQCLALRDYKNTMDMKNFLETHRKNRILHTEIKWSEALDNDVHSRAKKAFTEQQVEETVFVMDEFPEIKIESHGDDEWQPAKEMTRQERVIAMKMVRIPRTRPQWTKPQAKDEFLEIVTKPGFDDTLAENAEFIYDFCLASYYIHMTGFNEPGQFDYNWDLYGNLLRSRTRFTKDELKEIFDDFIFIRLHESVKSVADLIGFYYTTPQIFQPFFYEKIQSHGGFFSSEQQSYPTEINPFSSTGDMIIDTIKSVISKIKGALKIVKDKLLEMAGRIVYKAVNAYGGTLVEFMNGLCTAFAWVMEHTIDFLATGITMASFGLPTLYLLVDAFTTPTIGKWLALSPLFLSLYTALMDKAQLLKAEEMKLPIIIAFFMNVFSSIVYMVISRGNDQIESHGEEKFFYTSDFSKVTSMFSDLFRVTGVKIYSYGKFLSTMREFNTIVSGCKNVGTLIMSILEFMPRFIKGIFKTLSPAELIRQELKDEKSPFKLLSDKAIQVCIHKTVQDFESATECRIEYAEIKKQLYVYMQENKIAHSQEVARFLSTMDLAVRVPYAPRDANKQPFIVRLVGDAGVGKSTLSLALLSALKGESTEDVEKLTYYRNPGTEYWDGKVPKHKYCIYDDFNQDRDEMDLKELILLASQSRFYAAFSSVDPQDQNLTGMKGDVVGFDAIILCGNTTEIRANTLNSNAAINRRKHLIFSAEFINPKNRVCEPDWSHMRLSLLDNNDYRVVTGCSWEGIEAVQIVQSIINDVYTDHIAKSIAIDENIANLTFNKSALRNLDYSKALNHVQARSEQLERVRALYTRNHSEVVHRLGYKDDWPVKKEDSKKTPTYQGAYQAEATTSAAVVFDSHASDTGLDDEEIVLDASKRIAEKEVARIRQIEQTTMELAQKRQWDHLIKRTWDRIKAATFDETTFFGKAFSGLKFIFSNTLKWWIPIGATVGAISAVLAIFGWKSANIHSGERQNNVNKIKMHVRSHGEETDFLKNNVGKIRVGTTRQRNVNFIFVKGNIIMLNAHVFWALDKGTDWVEDGTQVTIVQENIAPVVFPFERAKIIDIDDDLVLYELPARVQCRSTITQHFWDGGMNLTHRDVIMYRHDGKVVQSYYGKVIRDNVKVSYTQTKGGEEIEIQTHQTCITNLPSRPGDCGSLVLVPTGLPNSFRVIGINIGSGPQGSITKLITREMIVSALNKFSAVIERAELHSSWQFPTAEEVKSSGFADTALMVHAISNKEISIPRKSKIKPSPLYDLIVEPKTDICILNMKDPRLGGVNVFKENMLKYGSPSGMFPKELMQQAVSSIIDDLNAKPSIRLRRCLTTFEAINGVQGYPYLTSLEMTTSAAFPFSLEGFLGEKRQLFDGEPGRYVPNANLQKHIDIIENRIANNVLPDYPFINTIKDERKDKEDVAKGKSRMFSMASVALTIVQRKYCLPIIAHLYQCRDTSFLSIGINKASKEWDQMVKYLMEVGEDFSDADYKKFDTRANLEARLECNKIFHQKWMSNDEMAKIDVLLRYDAQALHQWGKYILAIPSGTSSGSFITATIGSMLNETYIRMAWIKLMPIQFKDIQMYRKYVRTKNYGDDLVMTVNKLLKEHFHPQKIADFLETFNIQMTSGDKHSELGFKTVLEFTFLKNKTAVFFGSYVPLQQDPEEPLNWIRVGLNSEPPEVACEANCNSVLRTLFFYGEERFNRIRSSILEIKDYNLISYSSLLNEWFEIGELSDPDGTFTFTEGRSSIAKMLGKTKGISKTPPGNETDGQTDQDNMNFEIIDIDYKIESHSGVKAEGSQGTMDEPAAVSDVRFGTVTTDQTSPALVARVEGRSIATTARSSKYNPDGSWDLAKMLGRWNYVDTIIWKATDAVGTSIVTLDVLADLLTSEIAIMPFQRFNLARFSQLQVKLETVGYRFARGRLLVCFRPTQRSKDKITVSPSINDAIVLQAISLDPTAATIGQLNIDFTYFKQYIDLVNGDCLGQIHFIVQNAFTPGTAGSNECGIKVFFNLENAIFKQPRPAEATYASHLLPLRITSHSGLIDEAAKELKGLVHDILPDNIIGDALGGLLDAPQLGEQIPPLVNKEIQYFNNAKNPQYVDVLTLDPSSQQLTDKDVFSTGVNEMMIPELLKKCQFVKTVQWNATDPVGKILFVDNVGPMSDVPIPAIGNFALGMLSYISSFFTFWRGSIVYFVEIVGTQFHEGKLDFCFHPQISTTSVTPLTYKSRMSQYFRTVHIRNGSNVFGFRAIYPGDTPVKRVYNGLPLSDGPSDENYRFQNYFSGAISLVVSTLLNAPETVQPNVEVNIYKMAGPDYELFMNTAVGSSIQPVGEAPVVRIKSHGDDDDTIDRNTNWFQMKTETLGVGNNMAGDISQSHFGEYFHSIRDMCKRYTINQFVTQDFPLTTETISGEVPIEYRLGYIPSNFGKSYLQRVTSMFRNFRGATVHKIKVKATLHSETTVKDLDFTGMITQQASSSLDLIQCYRSNSHFLNFQPHAYVSNDQVAEFKVPFLCSRTSAIVEKQFETSFTTYEEEALGEQSLNLMIWPHLPPDTPAGYKVSFRIEWLSALADEATYGVFIGIPEVYIAMGPSGGCILPDFWQTTALKKTQQRRTNTLV